MKELILLFLLTYSINSAAQKIHVSVSTSKDVGIESPQFLLSIFKMSDKHMEPEEKLTILSEKILHEELNNIGLEYSNDNMNTAEEQSSLIKVSKRIISPNENELERLTDFLSRYINDSLKMIDFDIVDADAVEKEIYQGLIADARNRASKLSNALDREVGEITEIKIADTDEFGQVESWNLNKSIGWEARPPGYIHRKEKPNYFSQRIFRKLDITFSTINKN